MQMIVGAVLVNALHAALKDREEPFDGVGMDSAILAGHILAALVVHHPVILEGFLQQNVVVRVVGHDPRFTGKVLLHYGGDGGRLHIVNNEATGLAAGAINEGEHLVLVVIAAPVLLALGLDALIVADEGFVYLDNAAASAKRGKFTFPHGFSDSVRHEPSRFESDA